MPKIASERRALEKNLQREHTLVRASASRDHSEIDTYWAGIYASSY
jgi:hypothetical protein